MSAGFWIEAKAWDSVPQERAGFYEENPPEDWEQCNCCECYHPADYAGDCRSDINRWPSSQAIAAMEAQRCA